jgi:hypothetical protein
MHRLATAVVALALTPLGVAAQELVFESPATLFSEPDAFNQNALVGDLDGDGLQDVAAVEGGYEFEITALLALPGGGFSTGPTSPAGVTNIGYLLADFDGDGHLDLAGGGNTVPPQTVQLSLGVGDGSFAPTLDVPSGAPDLAYTGAAADMNGDGDLDLVTTTPFVELLLGNGDGSFTSVQSLPDPGSFFNFAQALSLADLDADGFPDVVVGMSNGVQRVYEGTGGGLVPTATVVDMGATGLFTGGSHRVVDVDGDGFTDLLSSDAWDLVMRFRPGVGGGAFGPVVTSPWPLPGTAAPNSGQFTWGDWDEDGVGDVAITVQDLDELLFLRGAGDGTFGEGLRLSTLSNVFFPVVIDADQDGRDDVVATRMGDTGLGLTTGLVTVRNATYGAGDPYVDLGGAVAGTRGFPVLVAEGPLTLGSPFSLRQLNGLPGALPFLVVGLSELGAPFKGGTLWPAADLITNSPVFGGLGESTLAGTWTEPLGGFDVWIQGWFADAGAVKGFASTTGVRASVP